jgi:hypothetical protein
MVAVVGMRVAAAAALSRRGHLEPDAGETGGGQRRQKARDLAAWIRQDGPDLRIVSEVLRKAAHARLEGAREDYVRRNTGRTWGRPINGTESKYLLTGLAQCGICGAGLFVHSRSHACSAY